MDQRELTSRTAVFKAHNLLSARSVHASLQDDAGDNWLRWFNLQSISEVKTPEELRTAVDDQPLAITRKSAMQLYLERHEWVMPTDTALRAPHALTCRPLWQEVLRAGGEQIPEGVGLNECREALAQAWPRYVGLLSMWQMKRFYRRVNLPGGSATVACKPKPAIVVVHPAVRFSSAQTDEQWKDACRWALLAYCNHGPTCEGTFGDASALEAMTVDEIHGLTLDFDTMGVEERSLLILRLT